MILCCPETEVSLSSQQELASYFVFQSNCCQYVWECFEYNPFKGDCIYREILLISVGSRGNILKKGHHPWNDDEALFLFHEVFGGGWLSCSVSPPDTSEESIIFPLFSESRFCSWVYPGLNYPPCYLQCLCSPAFILLCVYSAPCHSQSHSRCVSGCPTELWPSLDGISRCTLRFTFVPTHRYEYTTCQHISWQR